MSDPADDPGVDDDGGTGVDGTAVDDPGGGEDAFDELRDAAGAVVASLKWLIDATERVIEDPAAFSQAVDSGRSVVEAFTSGFLDDRAEASGGTPPTEPDDRPTVDGEAEPPADS